MQIQESIVEKDPWLAVFLSWGILPGLGQIYSGKIRRGIVIGSFTLIYFAILIWLGVRHRVDFLDNQFIGGGIVLSGPVCMILSYVDAHRCARKANENKPKEATYKKTKNPWIAVILSDIVPGLGHVYVGRWLCAIIFFLILVNAKSAWPNFFYLILSACVNYHAYFSTPTHKAISKKLITVVLFCSLVASGLQSGATDIVGSYQVSFAPMVSWESTFVDTIIVNKWSYLFKKPQRGDVIVFEQQADSSLKDSDNEYAICRIVGLPGENVRIRGDRIYINDKVLEEDRATLSYDENAEDFSYGRNQIPVNSYFLMGDRRYHPNCQKIISRSRIVGKAIKRRIFISGQSDLIE